MPVDDWMLAQGTVNFRNEAIRARHGDTPGPPIDALLDDDPDLYLATGPLTIENCDCDGICECDNQ